MKTIQYIGIGLFILSLLIFTAMLGIGHQKLTPENIGIDNQYHKEAILKAADEVGLLNTEVGGIAFISKIKSVFKNAANNLNTQAAAGLPDGVSEWDFKIGNWKIEEYTNSVVSATAGGPVQKNPCLLYTSPSPRDKRQSRMPSSA